MGKAAMCLQMLQILNSRRMYKVSELADLLDTNPRNISEYKKELEECGYYINTISGRYGGYQLERSHLLPTLHLYDFELEAFNKGVNYLLSRNDFLEKDNFQKAAAKVYSCFENNIHLDDIYIVNRFPLKMSQEELRKRFSFLSNAIDSRKVVKLTYQTQKNELKEYLFEPYELFMYNNSWFILGYNQLYKDFNYLKINRIINYEITDKKFNRTILYNRSDYINEYGFTQDQKEWYHLEFIVDGIYNHLIEERIHGKNEVITHLNDNETKVEVDMYGKGRILDYILGFQNHVKVLSPDWLIEDLKSFAEELLAKYNKAQ